MKGYWTGYGYKGKMHSGKWILFASDTEYREAYADEITG